MSYPNCCVSYKPNALSTLTIEQMRHISYKMKICDKKISGVLHNKQSSERYQLRRYLPDPAVALLVEQFWLVDWDLTDKPSHTQQNLPDPNMHLVIQLDGVKVIGPVSKKYSYTMQGKGRIIGVKFNLGVLIDWLPCNIDEALDKEFLLKDVFDYDAEFLIDLLISNESDAAIIQHLSRFLLAYQPKMSKSFIIVKTLVEQIKNDNSINQVEQLAKLAHTSVRNIQRLFKTYVGLSPKWLIRKYRLHYGLKILEENKVPLAELALTLGYADQSHLIRDFKEFLNMTPSQYK